jgi:hypothetical protein
LIGTLAGPKEDFMESGPGDRKLTQFLYWNQAVFKRMLPLALPHDSIHCQLPQSFNKLREAVRHAFEKNDLKLLYTKETALEFHYLLYGVFLLAGQAIRTIKDHHTPLSQTGAKDKKDYLSQVEKFKARILAAMLPMKLLQCLLSSTVFKWHIGVLTNDGESVDELFPKWSQKKDDVKFGIKQRIFSESKLGLSEESPNEGGGENNDTSKESCTDDGKDDDDDDDDDGNNLPEVCKSIWWCKLDANDASLQMLGDSKLKLQMFFGWVRTFVAHFLGKRNLEVYTAWLASADLNKRPEIRIFAVNSEQYLVPAWEEFQKVIRDALGRGSSDLEKTKIIQNLEQKVFTKKGLKPEVFRPLKLFFSENIERRAENLLPVHALQGSDSGASGVWSRST